MKLGGNNGKHRQIKKSLAEQRCRIMSLNWFVVIDGSSVMRYLNRVCLIEFLVE